MSGRWPLYPQKRTLVESVGTFGKSNRATSACTLARASSPFPGTPSAAARNEPSISAISPSALCHCVSSRGGPLRNQGQGSREIVVAIAIADGGRPHPRVGKGRV